MNIKTKYLIFLFVAIGIVSCTADSPEEPNEGKGAEMKFAVTGISRAAVATSFDKFAVYGDMKLPGGKPIVLFNGTEVKRDNGVWSYEGAQYWMPEFEHSFVGIHPLSVLEGERVPVFSNSQLSFTYTLPTTAAETVSMSEVADIVFATHRRIYEGRTSGTTVTLSFSHLLSLINFSLELTEPTTRSEECLKIHKLEMSGFGATAAINIKPAPRQLNSYTDDSEIEIITAKGSGSLEISFDDPIVVANGAGPVTMFGGNNAIIMLPQTFAGNDKVQIRLIYSQNDEIETGEVSATLSNFTWEWGKSYIYKIKLELEQKEVNMVISNATIAPWNLIEDPKVVEAR